MTNNILWQSGPDADRHEWRVETEEEWSGYDGLIVVSYFPCIKDRVAIPREHVAAIAQAMLEWAGVQDEPAGLVTELKRLRDHYRRKAAEWTISSIAPLGKVAMEIDTILAAHGFGAGEPLGIPVSDDPRTMTQFHLVKAINEARKVGPESTGESNAPSE